MGWKSLAFVLIAILTDGSAYAKTENRYSTIVYKNVGTYSMGYVVVSSSNNHVG